MSRSTEGVELTEHPADVGIHAWGPTRARTLELACAGLISIMTDPNGVAASQSHAIEVRSGAESDVLRRALSEVLFLVSAHELFFSSFDVEWDETITIVCRGERIDRARHELLTEVKAITPNLSFTRDGDLWDARVLVDV